MRDWYEDMAGEEHKAEIVARHLSRLRTNSPPEPEAITARKRAEAADRLMRQDEMFGVWPGVTLGAPSPVIDRPAFTAAADGRQAETSDD